MKSVQCKGDGRPYNIKFCRLEHFSDFKEHIRYIDVSSDGIAKLPFTIESKRYQDTGFYMCTASNGVSDENGKVFQRAKAYLVSTDSVVNYINVNPGKTIVLRYNYTATSVDWDGPNHENTEVTSKEEKDMYELSELEINYERFDVINEGQALNVCCQSRSVDSNQTLRWFNELHGMQEQRLSSTCFHFDEIFRNDSGVYTCIAEYEGGIGTKNITLVVSYSPSVKLIYTNFNERDKERVIQCVANGHPMNYSYRQWEHHTVFDEHIRYLTGNATGFLSLPIQKRKLRYQDTGVYVCSVSNGIQDTRGKLFQKEQGYVISKGTPRFVKDNTNKRYGIEGHQLDVKVKLYSLSNITCQLIESKGDLRMTPSVQINHVNVSAYFHGKNVKVPGLEVMFRFSELSKTDFKEYVVTVCNEFGNSSLTLEVLTRTKHSSKEKSVTSEHIVIAVLLILIVVLLVVMGVYVRYLQQRQSKMMINVPTDQTTERNSDESAHYIEIVDDNNVRAIFHEQNNQMVSADSRLVVENRNIFIMSEEHNLTLSNNDSDTSEHTIASLDNEIDALEHLDDGYERPYTTILAHNYAENEHCYSSIEKGLTNDTTSQNAACGPCIVFTERYKHNISICTDDAQQNTKRSMGEYINLSLKQ